MRESIHVGMMFNLIDAHEGVKADLVPITREPEYQAAFARRIRRTFQDEEGNQFEAWCAQPADIIIGKLKAWQGGRSSKHPSDIYGRLVFSLSGLGDVPIDIQAVAMQAARMDIDTSNLWKELVARAERAIREKPES